MDITGPKISSHMTRIDGRRVHQHRRIEESPFALSAGDNVGALCDGFVDP